MELSGLLRSTATSQGSPMPSASHFHILEMMSTTNTRKVLSNSRSLRRPVFAREPLCPAGCNSLSRRIPPTPLSHPWPPQTTRGHLLQLRYDAGFRWCSSSTSETIYTQGLRVQLSRILHLTWSILRCTYFPRTATRRIPLPSTASELVLADAQVAMPTRGPENYRIIDGIIGPYNPSGGIWIGLHLLLRTPRRAPERHLLLSTARFRILLDLSFALAPS
jgi:hypothetical protein